MKVRELIEKLRAMPLDADVLFDTEAARFNVHMVSVDSAFYEDEPMPHCGLHTKDPREYTGVMDRAVERVLEAARGVIPCTATTVPLMDAIDAYDKLIGRKT